MSRLVSLVESREVVREIFQILEGFSCALVGGLAVAYWVEGRVPTSRELDILVVKEDFDEGRDLFNEIGFSVSGYAKVGVGSYMVKGKGWEVDLILAEEEWEEDAIKYAKKDVFEGVEVRIVRPEWLIVMKLVAMREKDMDDIVLLSRVVDVEKVRGLVRMYLGEAYVEDFNRLVEIGGKVSGFSKGRKFGEVELI